LSLCPAFKMLGWGQGKVLIYSLIGPGNCFDHNLGQSSCIAYYYIMAHWGLGRGLGWWTV